MARDVQALRLTVTAQRSAGSKTLPLTVVTGSYPAIATPIRCDSRRSAKLRVSGTGQERISYLVSRIIEKIVINDRTVPKLLANLV